MVVAVLYALGLLAKPQVITFPLCLLLWDYWPLQRMFDPAIVANHNSPIDASAAAPVNRA